MWIFCGRSDLPGPYLKHLTTTPHITSLADCDAQMSPRPLFGYISKPQEISKEQEWGDGFCSAKIAFAGTIYRRKWERQIALLLHTAKPNCTFSKTLFQGRDCFLNKKFKEFLRNFKSGCNA